MVALVTKPAALSICVIAAINFAKQGSGQAKLFKLTELTQLPSHLVTEGNSAEFYLASNVQYFSTKSGSSVERNGLRFVRYKYDSSD